ncbi:MAG: transporter [Acidobacteriota bacterium]|nr:MAG: transporter [Acidobacteriota bacterium]
MTRTKTAHSQNLTLPVRALTVLLLALNLTGLAFGQDQRPPVSSDRPTVGASSGTVPWGAGQVEIGGLYQHLSLEEQDLSLRLRQFSTPLLFRFGAFENLELRLETAAFTWYDQRLRHFGETLFDESDSGFANPTVGLKWQFVETPDDSYQPAVGVLLNWALPIGSEAFRPEKSEWTAIMLVDFPLPRSMSLTLNGGVSFRYDETTRNCYEDGVGALVFAAPLGSSTGFFLEVAGGGPQSDGGEGWAQFDGGITHRLSDGLQVDAAIVRGLTDYTGDWGFAAGLSFYIF